MRQIQVSDSLIQELPDLQGAIRACILYSGKQLKEIAFEIGIERTHLSKMVNPSEDPRHFPPNKLDELMTICGNEIPLRWQAMRRGYLSREQVRALEDKVRLLEAKNDELVRQLEQAQGEAKHIQNNIIKFVALK